MFRSFVLFTILVLNIQNMYGAFSVTNIITDDFPIVKVNFTATTPAGVPYQNLRAEDFTVIENGLNMTPNLQLNCIESEEPAELSILLILDKSGSMDTNPDDGIRRWDWVVEGARKFVESIDFVGRTKIAITTFSGLNSVNLIADFTNDKDFLIQSVDDVLPFGPTYYLPPLIDDVNFNAVKLLSEQPTDMNRIVVFLTDGLPEPKEVTDNRFDEVIQQFSENNIQMYSITLSMPLPSFLSKISQETGGKSFAVYEREELSDIYQLIAIEAQARQICELSWSTAYGCDELSREREVSFDFLRDLDPLPRVRTYLAPERSIARLIPSDGDLLSFGNPNIGDPVTLTATFTVENSPFTFKGTNFTPATFFRFDGIRIDGEPADVDDVAEVGSEIEVDITFTQEDEKEFRQAFFTLEGIYCPAYMNLVGGFSKVNLVNPHSGVFSACEGIEIQWAGVEETTPVNLYYSTNNGQNWQLIRRNVTGGSYNWSPNFASDNIKIKIEREATQSYRWVHQGSNDFDAELSGIEMDANETFIYMSGYHQETLNFLDYSRVSRGGHDLFLTKVDKDGFPQWMIQAGTTQNDSLVGVAISDAGDIFSAGIVYQGIQIGTNFPNMQHPNKAYGMIMKVNPNGSVTRVITFGSRDNLNTTVDVRAIRYNAAENRIEVAGSYRNTLEFGSALTLPNSGNFVAHYDTDLNFINAFATGFNINTFKKYSHTDSENNLYKIDTFEDQIQFGEISLTSQDMKDIAVSKYGTTQASEDISREFFKVEKPTLEFQRTNLVIDETLVGGEPSLRVFNALLYNPSDLPVKLNGFRFTNNPSEFSMRTQLPEQILSKEEITLEFSFEPTALGQRSSSFTIDSDCADDITIQISGVGTCRGDSDELVDLGTKTIGIRSRIVMEDIFRNPTSQSVRITPSIEDDPNNEFEIAILRADGTSVASDNIPPKSSVSFEIFFTPNQEGQRTAKINYGVTSACENTFSDLIGEGINSSIVGTSPEIKNRIRTVNRGIISLENLSDLETEIRNLTIVNDDESYFKLINIQNSYQIQGNQTIEIEYEFTPLTEGEFNANLEYTLANNTTDASTELVGIGVFPNITYEMICPDGAIQTQTSQAILRITNNSQIDAVDIFQIESLTNDYKFIGNNNIIENINIASGATRDVLIDFTPINSGFINHDFAIIADVAIGNLTNDTFASDSVLPNLTGACSALSSANEVQNDFGNILICDKNGFFNYSLVNSSSVELIVNRNDVVITPNEDVFIVNMPEVVTLQPGQTQNIQVIFAPKDARVYNAKVEFDNNLNVDYILDLTGRGIFIDLTSSIGIPKGLMPGKDNTDKMRFNANVEEIAKGDPSWDINEIVINIKYNFRAVHLLENNITDLTGGAMNWTANIVSINEINIVGTGSLMSAYNGGLCDIEFYMEMSDEFESEVYYSVFLPNCQTTGTTDPLITKLDEFCARDFRIFETGGTFDQMENINPNPLNQSTYVTYSTAFDGPVKIEIYDVMGNSISIPVNEIQESGFHQFFLNIENLHSGVYFINFHTLTKIQTSQFIIAK